MLTFSLLIIIIILLIINIVLILTKKDNSLKLNISKFEDNLSRIDSLLREEFKTNRDEIQNTWKLSREELHNVLQANRQEIANSINSFGEKFTENIKDFNKTQKEELDALVVKLDRIKDTVNLRLEKLQEENSKKLEDMRLTVDEKLQTTLERRLTESFKQVSDRLEIVHRGLGEMQNLATGVGDLKKVLSNIKTRGILGEIQLGNILENILSPQQYEKNVIIKSGTKENVEYAIKLPGRGDIGSNVYLPIDSKFPIEAYSNLMDAYDKADTNEIKNACKKIDIEIKRCAKDIKDKYISPPKTTDFGILFLPIEGLYAEITKRVDLIESLQKDHKVIVAGPTTLAALLNSLQMGFRTLAIEKRTTEVWDVLGAVKTEFNKFGEILQKAKERISKANEDIEQLVGTRTKKIQSKLKNVQELPEEQAVAILDIDQKEL